MPRPDDLWADLHRPTYDALFQPTLDALRAAGGEAKIAEIDAAVHKMLNLSPELVAQRHKPDFTLTKVADRLRWARTYLRQDGLIDSPRRGMWALTAAGWAAEQVALRPQHLPKRQGQPTQVRSLKWTQ